MMNFPWKKRAGKKKKEVKKPQPVPKSNPKGRQYEFYKPMSEVGKTVKCSTQAEAIQAIKNLSLDKYSTVKTLNLKGCELYDDHIKDLAEMLKVNTSIQIINLNDNKFTGEGVQAINEAVASNFYVTEVFIFGNPCLREANRNVRGQVIPLEVYKYAKRNRDNNHFSGLYGKALKAGEAARWGRSKLMVIGQGGAGKTSTVRSLLNLPFNPNWDSTIGASLTKTSTTNWEQGRTNESDFNQIAAKVFGKVQKERAEEGRLAAEEKKKLMEQRKAEMAYYNSEEYQEEVRKRRKEFEAQRDILKKAAEAPGNAPKAPKTNKLMKKTVNLGVETTEEVEFAVDVEPESPENFEAIDPNKSLLSANEVAARYGQKMISQAVALDAEEDDSKVTFTIWDYGGQKVFYTLHHLFLTKYGVYLLAFNLCELIVKGKKKGKFEVNPEAVEYLQFWVNSVILHAPEAPIMLAGTHIDEIKKKDEKVVFELAEKTLLETVKVEKHSGLVKYSDKNLCFFPINNKEKGGIQRLREEVEKSVEGKFYVEQRIPLRWVFLCDNLLEADNFKDKAWHDVNDVTELAAQFDIPPREVVQMLKLFNQLGVMVYLDATNGLQNRVVTDPQWLLNKLGLVIRDEMHGMPDFVPQEMVHQWTFARETGIISESLLELLWENKDRTKAENKSTLEFLIDLMRNSMLLSEWDFSVLNSISSSEIAKKLNKNDAYFLVPSLIPAKAEVKEDFEKQEAEVAACFLLLDFSSFFLPTGVFQRYICLLLMMLKNYKAKAEKKQPLLGPDFARFSFKMEAEGKKKAGFSTDLFVSSFDKDCIKVSVTEEKYAPQLFSLVNAINKKVKSEVMGGKLEIEVLLGRKKSDQKEKGEESQKVFTRKEAKDVESMSFWFENTEKKSAAIAEEIDFDTLFG